MRIKHSGLVVILWIIMTMIVVTVTELAPTGWWIVTTLIWAGLSLLILALLGEIRS
jgi:hypothetical protein